MRHAIYFLLALFAHSAANQFSGFNLTALYGPGLSEGAEIVYASDADFQEETAPRYTIYRPPRHYGAILPATEADIQHIVRTSVGHGIPFLAIGGGHGITGTLGRSQSGISIELKNFDKADIDEANNVITIGGGVKYESLYGPMYNANKMMAMGNSPCVGAIGAALGGAVGQWQGLYGLGIDSLLSVRMITATGDLVVASEKENPDLFWSIRGAGANFGIITEATFQLHDAVNDGDVAVSMFLYTPDRNVSVWEAVRSFDDYMPDELAFNIAATINATTRERSILVQANWYGLASEAEPYLQPFRDAGPFLVQNLALPWPELQELTHTLDPRICTPGQYMNEFSISLKQTDIDTFTSFYSEINALWEREDRYTGQLVIARFPNRVVRSVPDSATVFPHRDATTHLLFENFYSDPSLDGTINKWMRETRARFQETSGFDELHVYSNFGQGDEGPRAWYGSRNFEKLRQLKRKWDPLGVFRYNNPIPW
ncbi:hypothetical protein BDV06DRAFT_231278 [Aspergillus oleicola]